MHVASAYEADGVHIRSEFMHHDGQKGNVGTRVEVHFVVRGGLYYDISIIYIYIYDLG